MAESSRTTSEAASSASQASNRPGSSLISFEEAGIPREHPALVWILHNVKLLGLGIGVVILAAAAWSGLSWHKERTRTQAAEALGGILMNANATAVAAQLEAFIQTAPEPVRQGAMLELAALYMASDEHAKAAETWGRVAAQVDQPMKITAGMGQAQALTLAGKAPEALALLRSLEQGAPASFETPLLRLKAQVAEAAEQYQEAIAAWATMMEKNPDQQSGFFRQKLAQLEALKAKKTSS